MTYAEETKVSQVRRSNYTGWVAQVVGAAFPQIKNQDPGLLGKLMAEKPSPVDTTKHVWRLACRGDKSEFALHVVETREWMLRVIIQIS